ncbi:hypothetical protein [Ideonella paludis]|uniref:WGR domain-containing protein n=1 Tax=Ideonella paludis TaxID=1233411 RepID=A0ABS5E376_9BURK|nr:hypothetical protein [Ideonella paludis]MBQ0937860.1 hypothetical protein [Ideonella paludis]
MKANDLPPWLTPEITHVTWESETRHYGIRISPNLWGELELHKEWGGRFSRRGNSMVMPVLNAQQAQRLIAQENLRRVRRGYKMRVIAENVAHGAT